MSGPPGDEQLPSASADLAREGPSDAGGVSSAAPLAPASPPVSQVGQAKPTPRWKAVAPFVLAIALLAFLFARTDLAAIRARLADIDVPLFLGFSGLFVACLLSADAFATVLVYRPILGRIRFRDLWVVRGASYLPSILNHHVGQAFVTVFLARSHNVPLARMAGGTIVAYASWAACLLLLGSGAVLATGSPAAWLFLPLGAGTAYLAILALRPARLAKIELLRPLFEAGVKGHLIAAAARVPHAAVQFTGVWISFRLFGVHIPAGAAFSYIPVLMVVVTLPITPQGFGTRDAAAAMLFLQYGVGATDEARRASIAACTLSWAFVLLAIEGVLGLLLLPRATKLLGGAKVR